MQLAVRAPCPLHTSTKRFWAIGMLLLPTILLLVVWSPFCTLCDLSSSESNKVCRTEKANRAAVWDLWCKSLGCALGLCQGVSRLAFVASPALGCLGVSR